MKRLMCHIRFSCVFCLVFFLPGASAESDAAISVGPEMAKTMNCIACHRIDSDQGRKRLGPDFDVIAKRYAGNDAAVNYLATRIRSGARGAWGAVPMPAQSHVSQDEAEALAQWIMSLVTIEPLSEK